MSWFGLPKATTSSSSDHNGNRYPIIDPLDDPKLGGHSTSHSHSSHATVHVYPHIPNMAEEPSAPPLPGNKYGQYGYGSPKHHRQPAGQVLVSTPTIEAQPWVGVSGDSFSDYYQGYVQTITHCMLP